MLLAFLLMTAHAAESEMDKIIQKLQACAIESGYPKVKACSKTAARDALALVDKAIAAADGYLTSAAPKDARFARAATFLHEAQQNWRPFVEAHCRFRMEFNGIRSENVEWRMDDCRLTQAKERFEALGNSYMK